MAKFSTAPRLRPDAPTATTGPSSRAAWAMALLYLGHLVSIDYVASALPILVRAGGGSLHQVALFGYVMVLWSTRFAVAPLLDRLAARRFSYRLQLLVFRLLVLVSLSTLLFTRSWPALAGCGVAVGLFSGWERAAGDALAVRAAPARHRSRLSAAESMGILLGTAIGGGVALTLGYRTAVLLILAIGVVTAVPVLLLRERPEATGAVAAEAVGASPAQEGAAARSGARLIGLLAVAGLTLNWLGVGLAHKLTSVLMVDQHLSPRTIGAFMGTAGLAMSFVGALLWIPVRRLPRPRLVLAVVCGEALSCALLIAAAALHAAPLTLFSVLVSRVSYATFSALSTLLAFTLTRQDRPATQVACFTAIPFLISHLAIAQLVPLAGPKALGYSAVFAGATVLTLLSAAFLAEAVRRHHRADTSGDAEADAEADTAIAAGVGAEAGTEADAGLDSDSARPVSAAAK
ncbi:MFS transporter [Streptomyces sp. NPDC050610]|uniref:MFS transporter n=1 Tax=Streptomyces sp. NPDC050610 TaxID=3157097 RepID=UPI003412419E